MSAEKRDLEKNFISAVIYINSSSSLTDFEQFSKKLIDTLGGLFKSFELIYVDDASPSEYVATIKKIHIDHSDIAMTILHMSKYQGMELSMNAGRDLAIGDFVIEFDECIYNFPDDLIEKAYRKCLSDIDIVSCADKAKSKMSSNIFYRIFNRFSDAESDLRSDNFRIISRRAINRIQALSKTIPYRKALYYESGLNTDTIEYDSESVSQYRHDRKSKNSRRRLAVDSLVLFTDIGYKCALALALIMAFIMICVSVYAIIVYVQGIAIVGWTTTMLFLSFAFFGLFVILTIVIKYLSLILEMIFKKNKYLFRNVEKL